MTFDMASFLLGMFAFTVVSWLGYHIVAIVETRIKERDEWNQIRFNSSPSQTYWGRQLETTPETFDDEVSITIRPPSRPGRPL